MVAAEQRNWAELVPPAVYKRKRGQSAAERTHCAFMRDAAESIAKILRLFGHDVRCEYDGHSALAAVRDYTPDVVVLDIGLPGMDGYEVASRLRSMDGRSLRIVAVTGYGQEEDRRRSRESGFDQHLTKPVDPDALQAFVSGASTG